MRAGLLAAGAIVGGIVVSSVRHGNSTTATSPTGFAVPGGTQAPGGTFQGGPLQGAPGQGGFGGGVDGEQHLTGTLVSVGSSTVTVRTTSGTATYLVTSSTEIVRNGQVVALSSLKAGDPVLVHVYPSGSSSRLTVERLFAGGGLTATSQERLSSRPARGPSLGA
jgi:hypothetical protein